MSYRSNQKGFAVIETLVVVTIIALVGFVGWYVVRSHENRTSRAATASFTDCKKASGSRLLLTYPEMCITKSGEKITEPVTDPATHGIIDITSFGDCALAGGTIESNYPRTCEVHGQKYSEPVFTIKEWKVGAPYSEPHADDGSVALNYAINAHGDAEFSDKRLDDLVVGTGMSCKGFAGTIARYSKDQKIYGNTTAAEAAKTNSSMVFVDGYYYQFIHAQAACSGPNPSPLSPSKQAQLETLLSQDNDTVKAIVTNLQTTD